MFDETENAYFQYVDFLGMESGQINATMTLKSAQNVMILSMPCDGF